MCYNRALRVVTGTADTVSATPQPLRRRRTRIRKLAAVLLAALAGVGAAEPAPPPPLPPNVPALPGHAGAELPGIFLYQVDATCRVTATRKLQGPESLSWRQVQAQRGIEQQRIVWRMIDGTRSQLTERRVKLRGELVEPGELVCLIRPNGHVREAWIERRDRSAARRQAPRRDPVPLRDGRLADLGTYSLTIEPGG